MANYRATATLVETGGGFTVTISGPNDYNSTACGPTNEHLISAIKQVIAAETGEEISKIGLTLSYSMKQN